MSELLRQVAQFQAKHIWATTANYRKSRGQVFTPPEIAGFMARLFS
jgi:type I restriction-modification system DNA methylase subunit